MDSRLYLCNVPELDTSYQHVFDFSERYEQQRFFRMKVLYSLDNQSYMRENQTFIVDLHISDLLNIDYLFFNNGYKTFYAFVLNKRYISERATEIIFQIDVWSTYLFDHELGESYVERTHVNRWNDKGLPTNENVDEGLNIGEMILIEKEEIYKMHPNFVVCTSVPIGTLENVDDSNVNGSGGSGGTIGGDWKNGTMSKSMFRFIKGYEGYAPYKYYDTGGVPTIGYGITRSEPDYFDRLISNQPCSETMCAKFFWEVSNKRYGKPIVNAVKNAGCTKQCQFDALVDVAYNSGVGSITNSNSTLMRAIRKNPNDEKYIRPIWQNYKIRDQHNVVQQGLKLRRKAECDVYFSAKYEKRTIPKLGKNGAIIGSFEGDGWLP